MTNPEPIVEQNKIIPHGTASTVSAAAAIVGVVAAVMPNNPTVQAVKNAIPVIGDALPAIITAGGALYAAASTPAKWLRRLFFWKKGGK